MFEPQSTPFASNSFATYGLATDLDFGYPVSAGGGGAGSFLYASQPPLPLRQHQQHQQHRHQHQHQQRRQQQHQNQPLQLPSPSSSVSSPYGTSGANSGSHLPPSPESRPDLSRFLQPYDTSAIKMEDPSQHNLAAQQNAAKDYQHIHQDPLVGNKTSSDAITQQYAEADPTYVEKTMALPQTYSHYRSIRGDGNCGWRAIGFSYFEKLIETGDQNVVEGEMARLMSVNSLLERVGGYAYWEDFADAMLGLLRMIAGHVNNPAMAHAVLLEQWNDSDVTNGIIYYLRLLAATYLKNSGGAYDAFVESPGGVQAYCGSHIEPVNKEIEHLGIIALFNILLQPPGMVLEVAYLDRSAGSQVNTYRWPEEATGQDLASFGAPIYLLYRPDHYDILYRAPPPPPIQIPTQPISMQVNRVAGFSHNTTLAETQNTLDGFSNMDYGLLSMIPGFSGSMSGMAPLAPPTVCSAPEYSPIQQNNWMPQFSEVLQSPTPQSTPQQPAVVSPPQPPSPPASLPSSSSSMCPPMVTTSGLGRRGSLIPPAKAGSYHIRFSPVQLDYEESKNNFPEPTFQVTTNTFKNSVWNRAHYGNPDFHPEEWSPDDEHMDCRTTSKKKVKKESSY